MMIGRITSRGEKQVTWESSRLTIKTFQAVQLCKMRSHVTYSCCRLIINKNISYLKWQRFTSAHMKPLSKSVWIAPAAWGALVWRLICQHFTWTKNSQMSLNQLIQIAYSWKTEHRNDLLTSTALVQFLKTFWRANNIIIVQRKQHEFRYHFATGTFCTLVTYCNSFSTQKKR